MNTQLTLDDVLTALDYLGDRYFTVRVFADDVDDTVLVPVQGCVVHVYPGFGLIQVTRHGSPGRLERPHEAYQAREAIPVLQTARNRAQQLHAGLGTLPDGQGVAFAVLLGGPVVPGGEGYRALLLSRHEGSGWQIANPPKPEQFAHAQVMKRLLLPAALDVSRSAIHTRPHESETELGSRDDAGGVRGGAVHGAVAPAGGERGDGGEPDSGSGRRGWWHRGRWLRGLVLGRNVRRVTWRHRWHFCGSR